MNIFKRIVRIICYIVIVFATATLIVSCFHSDHLNVTKYVFESGLNLEPYKAVVVSDFHHRDLEFPNGNLIDKINEEKPNAIFFAGDIIDQYITTYDPVLKIIDNTNKVPIYFVTGNHEPESPLFSSFLEDVKKEGREHFHYIDKLGPIPLTDKINLFGLEDPRLDSGEFHPFVKDYGKQKEHLDKWQNEGSFEKGKINILLTHRPDLMDLYSKYDVNMIIAGHTHGGQLRLGPLTRFIFSKKFSGYDYGEYDVNGKRVYVSSGLGYSAMLPIRVNCNPEILSITIK